MKRFTFFKGLLAAAMLWGATSVANAQQTIEQSFEDYEGLEELLPAQAGEEATYTLPTTGQWKLYNCKLNSGYLMLCKPAGSLTYGTLTLPAASFKVGSISVLTGTNASTKVEVSLLANDVLVETKLLDTRKATFTWTLADQDAGTTYKLQVANAYNAQFQSVTITEASASPTATVAFEDDNTLEFSAALNASQTQTVEVLGSNLTDDITVSLSGADASKFSLSTTTISKDGGNVDVTYTGDEAGSFAAVLNIASGTATASKNLTATTIEASHAGTKDDPLTIADVRALDNSTTGKYWVIGTIAGCAATVSGSAPTGITDNYVASNIALTQDGETVAMGVALPSGKIRNEVNLVDNAEHLGRTVMVYGTLEDYFGRPGVKSVNDYVLFVDLDENVNYTATTISKANVTLKRTLTADKYATFCIPFNMTAEQIAATFGEGTEVSELKDITETEIKFDAVATITANKPCILRPKTTASSFDIEGVSIVEPTNSLTETVGTTSMIGSYAAVKYLPTGAYYLKNNNFYTAPDETVSIAGFRAYLVSGGGAKPKNIVINGNNVTGIDGINADENAISGDIYTLGGQLVRKNATTTDGLAKGIYIVNGKKVVVK